MTGKSLTLIVLFCFVVIAAVTGILLYFVQSPCGTTDPACIREWFSAAGSWAGSIATIATLLFLVDQHRQLTALSKRPSMLLCDNVRSSNNEMTKPLVSGLAASLSFLKGPASIRPLDLEEARQALLRLTSLFSNARHDDFSREIRDTGQPLAKAREALTAAVSAIEPYRGRDAESLPLEVVQTAFQKLSDAFSATIRYRDSVDDGIADFKGVTRK